MRVTKPVKSANPVVETPALICKMMRIIVALVEKPAQQAKAVATGLVPHSQVKDTAVLVETSASRDKHVVVQDVLISKQTTTIVVRVASNVVLAKAAVRVLV